MADDRVTDDNVTGSDDVTIRATDESTTNAGQSEHETTLTVGISAPSSGSEEWQFGYKVRTFADGRVPVFVNNYFDIKTTAAALDEMTDNLRDELVPALASNLDVPEQVVAEFIFDGDLVQLPPSVPDPPLEERVRLSDGVDVPGFGEVSPNILPVEEEQTEVFSVTGKAIIVPNLPGFTEDQILDIARGGGFGSRRPEMRFSATPENPFHRRSGINQPDADLEIRPEDFIRIEDDVGREGMCSDMFSDIVEEYENIQQRLNEIESSFPSSKSDLDSIEEEIESQIGDLFSVRLRDLRESSITADQIQTWTSQVEQAEGVVNEAEQLDLDITNLSVARMGGCADTLDIDKDNLEERFSPISDQIPEARRQVDQLLDILDIDPGDVIPCVDRHSEIASRIESLSDDLDSISPEELANREESLAGEVSSIRSQVRSLEDQRCIDEFEEQLSRLKSRIRDGVDLGCSDIPRGLRTRARDFPEEARQFEGLDQLDIEEREFNSTVEEGQRLIEQLEQEVSDANPCKGELLSQVRRGMSILDDINVVDEDRLPCSARFPTPHEMIERIEEDIEQLGDNPSEGDIESIIRMVDRASDRVRAVDDQGCAEQFAARIDSLERRVERSANRFNIDPDIVSEAREQREGLVEDIRKRADQIEEGRDGEDDGDDEEFTTLPVEDPESFSTLPAEQRDVEIVPLDGEEEDN